MFEKINKYVEPSYILPKEEIFEFDVKNRLIPMKDKLKLLYHLGKDDIIDLNEPVIESEIILIHKSPKQYILNVINLT